MDTDSLPPLLVFIVFLPLFAYLSLAEHAGSNGGGILRESSPAQRAWFILAPLKYACVIALAITSLQLARLTPNPSFLPLTVPGVALALLALLTVVHRIAALLGQRQPGLAERLARPVTSALRRGGRSRNGAAIPAGRFDGEEDQGEPKPALNITEEDLVAMDRHDREMLRSIIQLDNSTAREVMVPRLDMVAIELTTPLREATAPIIASGHTRIPVYEENLDHIVGIIHSLDLLQLLSRDDGTAYNLRDLLREPYFIPESKRLDALLQEFQERAVQMAIVVDEWGGTEGLITMEDLLEEIVGEIEDEFSKGEEPEIKREPDGAVLVSAGVTPDVIGEMFHTTLDNPDVDTVGGYVYTALGRMPRVGDVVETEQLVIEVISVIGRRINRLRIRPGTPAAPQNAAD